MKDNILITIKKVMVAFLVVLTVIGLSVTTTSALSKDDKAELTITNIKGKPTVTLYQIGEGKYSERGDSFIRFELKEGVKLTKEKPTSQEINKIANDVISGTLKGVHKMEEKQSVEDTYVSPKVSAGIYIAMLTGAADGFVYNPILLTASYNGEQPLKGGKIDVTSKYLYGEAAVAKSSQPTIHKDITKSTTDGDKATASVCDKVDYSLTVQLPSYSKEATNKTVFVSDTMSKGLTFLADSLRVKWNGQTLTAKHNVFEHKGKIIAELKLTGNGFNINFNYDNLESHNPEVTYSAVLNEKAAVGREGNANSVDYYYSNNPNKGETHKTAEKPQEGQDITKKTNQKIVYTYRVAFKKTGKDNKPLANAVFGIYSNKAATSLVDVVVTNQEGYAASSQVGAGTYYLKEIKAPKGYSLNTKVYALEASWTSANTRSISSRQETIYTSDDNQKSPGTKAVGWLVGNVFYKEKPEAKDAKPAYIKKSTEEASTTTEIKGNQGDGSGTVLLKETIPNTKLGELPSTGSIGTYIFTTVGAAAMVGAVGIYIVKRRKA
ncbi:TPA: isopeptide-forming domain-containing fimbrial protein [Streptococcus equi subsp. zooepidemicus]|uniref:isopeptide-forming domain-containing fimbrial protein n=1 Tax=Streptococcus equi TaxID=1336 RepID=UPI001E30D1B4|nr:isopeptide-forming domain-containing fimbrial protein [Streptococcus equi subsp. zooepidemicus]HEL0143913.1 isopeptide-forming domain-containing fimbrial protein [Streptococcus equi subsp. zooepidemicus]HEL0173922.1 isopeptide-forming domain-containing fimbrial protein [Streptococcus equi subsp. zooepidemicus]HEL0188069.1 isopeptide-forming domain-containing fimbrial protein [Streptococcus equi subsp. zooepidemicus]HEL0214013.1 isopeptide-forming domain-containing fimbrial protein [Streptoco